jgi:hypothetical protein
MYILSLLFSIASVALEDMIKKCLNHKKLVSFLLIFLISGFGILGIVGQAKAFDLSPNDWILRGATSLMVIGIKILGGVLNIAVTLLTKILNWGNFVDAPIVKIGWTITRDLANMFFVLVLLVIAFGLILRKETFGSKKLLTNLIIAALLINFSLVICGVIIDSSQVLTDFFITQSGGSDLMETNLMNATQAVGALTVRSDVKANIGTEAKAAINVFIGAFLSVIFMAIIFLVFAAYAFFLIARIVALWVLLIFAPLVWLLWAMPSNKGYFKKWWDAFLKWCFFAPIAAFFIYLAIFSYKSLLTNNIVTALESKDTAQFLPQLTSLPNLVAFCIIIALLLQGLKIAQTSSGWGSNAVMNFAKGRKDKIIGWGKRRAKELTARPTGRATGAIAERLAKRGILSRQLARPLRATAERTKAADKAAIERYEKKYKPYSEGNLKSEFKAIITTPQAKAAIAKILADRNKVDAAKGFTDEDVKSTLNVAKKYNLEKPILNSRPDLAPSIGGDIDKIIMNLAKVKDSMKNLSSVALDNKNVINAIKNQMVNKNGTIEKKHLKSLGEDNKAVFVKIKEDIIDEIRKEPAKWEEWKKNRPDMTKYIESGPYKALSREE